MLEVMFVLLFVAVAVAFTAALMAGNAMTRKDIERFDCERRPRNNKIRKFHSGGWS